MNNIVVYLIGLAITILICFVTVLYFKPHLKKILLELNNEKERPANFWVAYTVILLLLIPLIFAMMITPASNPQLIYCSFGPILPKWVL